MQEMQVRSLGQEDTLEEGMATHSSILAWRIPWTKQLGGLQSTGSQRVGHNGSNLVLHKHACLQDSGRKCLRPFLIKIWTNKSAQEMQAPLQGAWNKPLLGISFAYVVLQHLWSGLHGYYIDKNQQYWMEDRLGSWDTEAWIATQCLLNQVVFSCFVCLEIWIHTENFLNILKLIASGE